MFKCNRTQHWCQGTRLSPRRDWRRARARLLMTKMKCSRAARAHGGTGKESGDEEQGVGVVQWE